jgi:hypothetical protein
MICLICLVTLSSGVFAWSTNQTLTQTQVNALSEKNVSDNVVFVNSMSKGKSGEIVTLKETNEYFIFKTSLMSLEKVATGKSVSYVAKKNMFTVEYYKQNYLDCLAIDKAEVCDKIVSDIVVNYFVDARNNLIKINLDYKEKEAPKSILTNILEMINQYWK